MRYPHDILNIEISQPTHEMIEAKSNITENVLYEKLIAPGYASSSIGPQQYNKMKLHQAFFSEETGVPISLDQHFSRAYSSKEGAEQNLAMLSPEFNFLRHKDDFHSVILEKVVTNDLHGSLIENGHKEYKEYEISNQNLKYQIVSIEESKIIKQHWNIKAKPIDVGDNKHNERLCSNMPNSDCGRPPWEELLDTE
jgi:hypothetical protein